MGNKVKYGLKNVHYAVITVNSETGAVSYGVPKRIPGAVTLSAPPKGEKTEFFADDSAYFVATANQGYEGTLEVALVPDSFKKDVLGYREDANGVLFEAAEAVAKDIALLFEFNGDQNGTRHIFYNVAVGRPGMESSTKGQSIEVKTETMNITASPALDTGYVKAKADAGTSAYDNWFNAVYVYEGAGV